MKFLRKLGRGSVRSTVGRKPLSALPKEVAPAVASHGCGRRQPTHTKGAPDPMTVTDTYSVHVDHLIHQLDDIVGRLTLADANLRLERESAKWWIVVDLANHEQVMVRAERDVCERFMAAFCLKHPEARIVGSGGATLGADGNGGALPDSSSAGEPQADQPGDVLQQPDHVLQAGVGEPASSADNVVPIREGVA